MQVSILLHLFIALLLITGCKFGGDKKKSIKQNAITSSKSAAKSSNQSPIAYTQKFGLDQDSSRMIILEASDPERASLNYIITIPPSHGTLTGIAAKFVYTPVPGFFGSDSFNFKVSDGTLESNEATIFLDVHHINHAPSATLQSIYLNQRTERSVVLQGSDPDNNPITFAIVSRPTKGTLSGTAPNLIYTPTGDSFGADSFTFKVNDGVVDSIPAIVSININFVNRAPIANGQFLSVEQRNSIPVTLSGSDVDGQNLAYFVVTRPTKGTLSGTAPNLIYTPTGDSFGADSFTFKVNDGVVDSISATVSISINFVNRVPIASGQSLSLEQRTSILVTLSGSDVDGQSLTYFVVAQPTKGTLSGTVPNLIYTPSGDNSGSDSFSFKVNDGVVDSVLATIYLNINMVNRPPIATAQSVSLDQRSLKSISLNGNDLDANSLSYRITSFPMKGDLFGIAPNLQYFPRGDSIGSDFFSFVVNDGVIDSIPATVSITINFVNRPPVATPQTISLTEGTATVITLLGSDPDGQSLSYSIVSDPSTGTLSGSGNSRLYTSDESSQGSVSFRFKVFDGFAYSNEATVTINLPALPTQSPIGTLNGVRWDKDLANYVIYGSAYDPDAPGSAVDIHVYFRGGVGNGGVGMAFPAVTNPATRQFQIPLPDAYKHEGALAIYAYAIDKIGGNNNTSLGMTTLRPKQAGILYFLHHAFAWDRMSGNDESAPSVNIPIVSDLLLRFRSFTELLPFVFSRRITMTTPVDENGKEQFYCFYDDVRTPFWDYPRAIARGDYKCSEARMDLVIARHVRQLNAAGIDFIVIDNSNNPEDEQIILDPNYFGGEVTIHRPIEVFMKKWAQIPNAPKVAILGNISSLTGPYHLRMLREVYNKPEYQHVLMRNGGKKVFFYVDNEGAPQPQKDIVQTIRLEITQPQNNIVAVPMWTHFKDIPGNGIQIDESNRERWDFLSPCLWTDNLVSGNTKRGSTTSIISPQKTCDQFLTTSSPIGSVMTARASYHVDGNAASQALGSTGRLGGLTLKKQFDKILRESPDYVFISGWNEHTAGNYYDYPISPSGFASSADGVVRINRAARGVNSGLGDLSADTRPYSTENIATSTCTVMPCQFETDSRNSFFVDTYAAEFSSDFEPTKEYGRDLYDILAGLLHIYKNGNDCTGSALQASDEAICRKNYDYSAIWSLHHPDGRFAFGRAYSETGDLERNRLKQAGYGEICATTLQQDAFARPPGSPGSSCEYLPVHGPFIAYNANKIATAKPIYRCQNANNNAFWYTSNVNECSAHPAYSMNPNEPLFYVSPNRTHEMLRAVRRCFGGTFHSMAIDARCPTGTVPENSLPGEQDGIMGYVH